MKEDTVGQINREAKPFPEMLSSVTDPDLEVFQVTTNLEGAGNTRNGFFSADGSRFFFARHWTEGGLSGRVQYTLCEVRDGFALRALTAVGEDPHAPVVSPDGRYFYYSANHVHHGKPRVALKRVELKTFAVETLTVFDAAVEGVGRIPKSVGGGSLRSDGRMLCLGLNFEAPDGNPHYAPAFVDLDTLAIRGFDWEPFSWRVGGSYYRGSDRSHLGHLLMCQCNRSQAWDQAGTYSEKWYSDIHRAVFHVVDEQGTIVATVPIGGEKEGVDHSYWRGGRYEIAIHSGRFDTAPFWRGTIMCVEPIACDRTHWASPRDIPGAKRVELTRKIHRPDVCHMSWHPSGDRAVCDTEGWQGRGSPCLQGPAAYLYLARVIDDGTEEPYVITKHLLQPRSSWNSAFTENCPELAPDGQTIFFNSDWTCKFGAPQVFAVRGFAFPEARGA